MYKVRVNNIEIGALYDTGASISVMSKCFFDKLPNRPKLIQCNSHVSGAGEGLIPVGECFIQLHTGRKMFRNRVIVIKNVKYNYILGQILHQANRFGTGYSTTGRHYIAINGKMIAQAISQAINSPILKMKGKITLPPMSISIVAIKTPTLHNTSSLYELNFDTFELPEGVVLLDIVHRVDHKTPQSLNIPILNVNNSSCSSFKGSPIATLTQAEKCKEVQGGSRNNLQCDTAKLLPTIPQNTSLQLEPNTKSSLRSIPDAFIPEEARVKLQDLCSRK